MACRLTHGQGGGGGLDRCREVRPPTLADLEAEALMPTSVGGPAPISSRQGRDKQRYTEDGARLVAG